MKKPIFKLGFFVLAIAAVLASYNTTHAFFLTPGETGSSFLDIPVTGRATALSESMTSVSGDATTLDYNPAGLAGLKKRDLTFSYVNYLEESSLNSIQAGFIVRPSFFSTKKPKVEQKRKDRVFMGLQYKSFSSEDTARNEIGVKSGDFEIKDRLIQLSFAFITTRSLMLGIGGKYIGNQIQSESGSTFAFDGGFIWRPVEELSFGASLLNLGQGIELGGDTDPLPTTGRFGVGAKMGHFQFLADAKVARDKEFTGSGGIEFDLGPFIVLRGGALYKTMVHASGGLGIRFYKDKPPSPQSVPQEYSSSNTLGGPTTKKRSPGVNFGLDYGFQTRDEFGIFHTISLKILY